MGTICLIQTTSDVTERLAGLTLRRLALPLTTPYKLAFGTVADFETILIEARGEDGTTGFGEATILTGYTTETPAGSWKAACKTAGSLTGEDCTTAKDKVAALIPTHPFAATALITSIEMLEGHHLLCHQPGARVPLIAILNAMEEREIEAEIEGHLAAGYGTLKIKVGFDAKRDLERVRFIQGRVGGRALLRIDGNQGYGLDQACSFAAALEPAGIELFEQPCPAGDWDAARAVAATSAVPMMLDESIYGPDDIDRAAELGAARFAKLKLMKLGGLTRLADGLARIERLGMIPVLGNGVAADPGCWMEACVAGHCLSNAGEMNGFLKPRQPLFKRPLTVTEGAMVMEPGPPEIDPIALEAQTLETVRFPADQATQAVRAGL